MGKILLVEKSSRLWIHESIPKFMPLI